MKLITETTEEIRYLTEDKEDGKKELYIEGVFLQGGIKNRNGRMYPVDTLAKEVKRYTENYVDKNRAFGELGHPDSPTINLDRVSHMIKSIRQEGNNFIGKAKIMDTPYGNIVKSLIDRPRGLLNGLLGYRHIRLNIATFHKEPFLPFHDAAHKGIGCTRIGHDIRGRGQMKITNGIDSIFSWDEVPHSTTGDA